MQTLFDYFPLVKNFSSPLNHISSFLRFCSRKYSISLDTYIYVSFPNIFCTCIKHAKHVSESCTFVCSLRQQLVVLPAFFTVNEFYYVCRRGRTAISLWLTVNIPIAVPTLDWILYLNNLVKTVKHTQIYHAALLLSSSCFPGLDGCWKVRSRHVRVTVHVGHLVSPLWPGGRTHRLRLFLLWVFVTMA